MQRYHPRHIVHPSNLSLQEALAVSDVVISAVPSPSYKVKTEWLKDGCICVNVASEKNFEKDVRDKVGVDSNRQWQNGLLIDCRHPSIFRLLAKSQFSCYFATCKSQLLCGEFFAHGP